MDIDALRSLGQSDGNAIGAKGTYLTINLNGSDASAASSSPTVDDARNIYSFMLKIVRDGALSTTKVVGLIIEGDNQSRQFITAGLTTENFAEVSSAITRLHISGWHTADDVIEHNLIKIVIKPDAELHNGIVTSSDVKIIADNSFAATDKKAGNMDSVDSHMSFIEKSVKLFTLVNPSKITPKSFCIRACIMNECGSLKVSQIFSKLHIYADKTVRHPFDEFVYFGSSFNMGNLITILPVNITQGDANRAGQKTVHFNKGILYIPVRYHRDFSFEEFRSMFLKGLDISCLEYKIQNSALSQFKKEDKSDANNKV